MNRLLLALGATALAVGCGGSVVDSGQVSDAGSPDGSSGGVDSGATVTCGTRAGTKSCAANEFCSYVVNRSGFSSCGSDNDGTCEKVPTGCTEQYAPVCGCDDRTYGNECAAHAARVAVHYQGPCNGFRCGTQWCDALTTYCEVPSPSSKNPEPTCRPLPNRCLPTGGREATCSTCFPSTPCPMGVACNPKCSEDHIGAVPTFTLTYP